MQINAIEEGCNSDVEVSIFCATYNQVDYIADALDSFLMQKTSFGFEVLVNDDASTDGTTDVVLKYASRYANVIAITHAHNHFLEGNNIINCLLPRAHGRYFAFCEGDDFWTSPYKLQRQFEVMEGDRNCVFCVHANTEVRPETRKAISTEAVYKTNCYVPKDSLC